MTYGLWNWFTKEKEEQNHSGLKAAIESNRQETARTIKISKTVRTQSRDLLHLAEKSLDILERAEKKK